MKHARKRKEMPDHSQTARIQYDPATFTENMTQATKLWNVIFQKLSYGFIQDPSIGHTDPLNIGESFLKLANKIVENPYQWQENALAMWKEHAELWHHTTQRLLGSGYAPDDIHDRRFKDDAWHNNTFFDYLRRSYLINSKWMEKSVQNVQGLDAHTASKISFFTKQFVDAMSPSNFLMTNPQAMRETLESNGANLVKGLENMLEDIERGDGKLRISMTDEKAFELGKNIACTEGSVVYENDLMQLIQYKPTTKQVHEIPLLIIPAWINKYYVLDLRPENSFIKWAVDQGYTVFVISWVNPDETLGRKRFDDYLMEGPLTALNVIEAITGSEHTNAVGYCLGGTLLAITLAYLRAHGMQHRVKSTTYLTTMIDFSDAGEMSIFIDDEQLKSLENRMSEKGYLDAEDMATTFNMLRSNDLIWSFVVNNYLLGKDPFPFDLLYWNSDSTRMPAEMHSFYLRNMYQKNLLVKPGGIELCGTPINLSRIDTPAYILSTKEDHISPWKSTYTATQVFAGSKKFVLAQSGHIAGVINPPSRKKYGYWTNRELPAKTDQWLEKAHFHKQTSWWEDWEKWLKRYSGEMVKARKVGSRKFKSIEAAPGSYARIRSWG